MWESLENYTFSVNDYKNYFSLSNSRLPWFRYILNVFCNVKFPNIKCAFSHIFVHTETQAGLLYANQPPLKGASQSCVRWERKYLHLNINTFREGCTNKKCIMYGPLPCVNYISQIPKMHSSDLARRIFWYCPMYLIAVPWSLGNLVGDAEGQKRRWFCLTEFSTP